MAYLVALLCGVAMGGLIQLVRASDPGVIARNLRLEDLSIVKFMATTIAVGMVLVYALKLAVPVHFAVKPIYLVGVLGGGLIFGIGFALGGYCPGTCVVGAGEGRRDALWAILGGLLGALVFTLVYVPVVAPINRLLAFGSLTLPGLLHLPGWLTAVGVALLFTAILALLPSHPGERVRG